MQQDGPFGSLRHWFFVTLSVTLFLVFSAEAHAGVSFSSISGEISAAVPGDSQNEVVSDFSGNDLSLQAFGGGIIDQANSSVVPAVSNLSNAGGLFEFSANSTSSTNGASDPPNEPRASSTASFEQLFQTDTAHRITLKAIASRFNGGAASLRLTNTQSPNSPLIAFDSTLIVDDMTPIEEQYRSLFVAPGSYAVSAITSSELLDSGSSSGSVGGTLAVSVAADTSGDSFVDGEDLGLWQETYGEVGFSVAANGDFNSNFLIDGTDFLLWQRQFNPGPPPEIAAVPSPSSGILVTWGIGILLGFRRRC